MILERFDKSGVHIVTTVAELEEIRRLISIAVWIRSEQLAHPDSVLAIVGGHSGNGGVRLTQIDTHDLDVENARKQFEAGQHWYKKLGELINA